MKISINTKVIKGLYPCINRLDNWKKHYGSLKIDAIEFLELPKITHSDKLWVVLRLLPRFYVEVFATDLALRAAASADAAAYAYADAAAAYVAAVAAVAAATVAYVAAADDADVAAAAAAAAAYADAAAAYVAAVAAVAAAAAAAAAARTAERQYQIDALKYLIKTSEDKNETLSK